MRKPMNSDDRTVTIAHDVEADADGIRDGREVARALIRQAMGLLSPYAEGCPVCTYALLSGIGFEVLQEDRGPRRIDAVACNDANCVTPDTMAAHVARARPSTAAMLERHGQTHHREHLGEGVQLSEDEADTIERLATLTGRTASAVIERVNRSPEDRRRFRVTVSLATEAWDYLDGTIGEWSEQPDKQGRQLASYAASLFGNA